MPLSIREIHGHGSPRSPAPVGCQIATVASNSQTNLGLILYPRVGSGLRSTIFSDRGNRLGSTGHTRRSQGDEVEREAQDMAKHGEGKECGKCVFS